MADHIAAGQIEAAGQVQARRPRADAERNRTRLLDAARAAFASGQAAVTLEQIARDAEVGIGTLYRHFPTREALVEAIYRRELADLCHAARPRRGAPARARAARLDGPVRRLGGRQTGDGGRAASRLRLRRRQHLLRLMRELTVAVKTILDAGVANGTLRDDVRPEDLVAMIIGIFTATSLADGRQQRERMFDLVVDAVRCPAR